MRPVRRAYVRPSVPTGDGVCRRAGALDRRHPRHDDDRVQSLAWDDPVPPGPRRVLVAGSSGAGKTTLAAALGARWGIPHHELDALHHGPDWVPRPQFAADVAAFAASAEWVAEWQYDTVRRAAVASHPRSRRRMQALLASGDGPPVVRLRTRREVGRWLAAR